MDEVVTGSERCRQLVQSINKKLGFVTEETWATLNRETRDAFRLKDDIIYSAVSTYGLIFLDRTSNGDLLTLRQSREEPLHKQRAVCPRTSPKRRG